MEKSSKNVIARLTKSAEAIPILRLLRRPFRPPRNDGELVSFFRDIKFEHSIFALPFAYLGLFLAVRGWPRFGVFFWITIAMVSFRTFGMAINRLVDRRIDYENPRTQDRALPRKLLSVGFVWTVILFSLALFLISTWILGPLCFLLAPIPIFLAGIYSFLKRFTWLSHFVLGMILGIAPYGAWLAAGSGFSWIPGLLLMGVASWVAGFDILYSLADIEFDRKAGLVSIPVRFGIEPALGLASGFHALALLCWAGVGKLAGLGFIYALGLAAVGIFFLREHWLVHRFKLEKLDQAFFTMNAGVSVALFVATLLDLSIRFI